MTVCKVSLADTGVSKGVACCGGLGPHSTGYGFVIRMLSMIVVSLGPDNLFRVGVFLQLDIAVSP